jgi:sulfhydrogenase subunit alpha
MTVPPVAAVRTIAVPSLTRVEGQGALRIRVAADGSVDFAEFAIYEPPRFFERLLRGREIREVPDIVARICGICPVAYQLTACGALEDALGIAVTSEIRALRRLLCCGEWIQSHALHVFLLHAADYLGLESGFALAAERPDFLDRGLRLKAIGSRIIESLGGRAVHPVNVTVGGFFRPPDAAAIRGLLPELEWGLGAALDSLAEVRRFDFPSFERAYECVAVRPAAGYLAADAPDESAIASSSGLAIATSAYERHFRERQVPHSTALHSLLEPGHRPYLVGPIARMNLFRDRLPPLVRRAADGCGIDWPCRDTFQSILVRLLEIAAACEEAIAIVRACRAAVTPWRIDFQPRAGTGCHATEAPRGLLYHRYEIGPDGLIAAATIVPPTSQNQAQIEADLRGFLPGVLHLPEAEATARCEHLIRGYDPCISCATHFLQLGIATGQSPTLVRDPWTTHPETRTDRDRASCCDRESKAASSSSRRRSRTRSGGQAP